MSLERQCEKNLVRELAGTLKKICQISEPLLNQFSKLTFRKYLWRFSSLNFFYCVSKITTANAKRQHSSIFSSVNITVFSPFIFLFGPLPIQSILLVASAVVFVIWGSWFILKTKWWRDGHCFHYLSNQMLTDNVVIKIAYTFNKKVFLQVCI